MMLRPSALAFVALTLALAACSSTGSDAEPLQGSGSAIVGGTTDSKDNAVAYIRQQAGDSVSGCTGTLIAPSVLLTAGHCVVADEDCNGGGGAATCEAAASANFMVYGGTIAVDSDFNVASPAWQAKVLEVHPHPNYGVEQDGEAHDDVGILILDQIDVLSGEAPKPVAWLSSPNDAVYADGAPFRAVGFGLSNGRDRTGRGTKREVALTVSGHDDKAFAYGSSAGDTCSGDSGGPAFAVIDGVETVIGTTSSGDAYCEQDGSDMRVDAFADFIGQFTGDAAAGPPAPPAPPDADPPADAPAS